MTSFGITNGNTGRRTFLSPMFLYLTLIAALAVAFVARVNAQDVDSVSNIPELIELNRLQLEGTPRYVYDASLSLPYRTTTIVGNPRIEAEPHTLGNLRITQTNLGQFTTAQFPGRSGETYMSTAGLWVGAVKGRDTLVTTGIEDNGIQEFFPGETDSLVIMSINPNDEHYHPDAVSEQDIIATYYDTLVHRRFLQQDPIDNREHIPLNIKVVERSMQWSYEYARDFILFDYQITNLDLDPLTDVYLGVFVDGDTYYLSNALDPAVQFQNPVVSGTDNDDLVGYLKTFPARCGFIDTIDAAYILDNDGDPNPPNRWSTVYSLRHVTGVRMLRTPDPNSTKQFNWWLSGPPWFDFGPRLKENPFVPFRDMNGFLGTPYGDKNKYYIMRNMEHDYDQLEMKLSHEGDGWMAPSPIASALSRGANPRFLLSYGPFSIFPGQTIPFTFAYVAGENAHIDPRDFDELFDPFEPDRFKSRLDFRDFALNVRWADWIYDNPGIDTDFDGYRGKSRECVLRDTVVTETTLMIDSSIVPYDTQYQVETRVVPLESTIEFYAGDDVPDFVGASPPPAPKIRLIPENGRITVRWNGYASETTADPFTDEIDFEGYRVYSSFTPDSRDFVMLVSYDRPNYNRYVYVQSRREWELPDNPFTIEQLRQLYGPDFNPLDFNVDNPFIFRNPTTGESQLYYFTTADWNRDQLNVPGAIAKRFPNAVKPPNNPDLWTSDDITEDGLPKYYEYEYVIENLLNSQPIYASVTAFDFGSPRVQLPSLESSQLINMVQEFPLQSSETAQAKGDPVIVYPNPYRADGAYREKGFEGRGMEDFPPERVRRINFINLPLVCKIFIYSLDGDLIRQIDHDRPEGGPMSMHDSWDVLSRNLQPVVSGIYYWIVQEPDGSQQVGKLAIIM